VGGLSWPATYVRLVVLYVAIRYMFVSQSSQVLASSTDALLASLR